MTTRLAVLGCGNMGSAIALGLHARGAPFAFFCYTPTHTRAAALARRVGGVAARALAELARCEYFLLACKPQQFPELAAALRPILPAGARIVSMLAGTSTEKLRAALGQAKIARAMPNTPCAIGEGATAIYCLGMDAAERAIVRAIFAAVGAVFEVDSDDAIDLATAIVGSGPAYFFEIARILAHKLAAMGLPADIAAGMAAHVIKGAGALLVQSADSAETLREKVTSKKGTTAAALDCLRANHLERILGEALDAAYRRAKELASA
ncbi:MAG: pyrroline-5-carboxylate reductase [Deltaproteobacteria bacterium]|nr:pyrroline-5-carboxylate reductase [Deltaproteobacteria bacterium]